MATFVPPSTGFTLWRMSRTPPEDRLDSWKAIARYLGRSVRTVRRWEQQEGMPVHRLMHQSQASVYAFRQELDDWREARVLIPSDPQSDKLSSRPVRDTPSAKDVAAAIAVLPFNFAGPDPSQAWVADGLTEEMIGGFSRLARIRVTSRTSSAAFKGSDRDSSTIADMLGVTYLLGAASWGMDVGSASTSA